MTRVRALLYAFASLLAIGLGSLVAVQPASAATCTWKYSNTVALGVCHNGKTVTTATVELEASPGIPTTLTLHYSGSHSNGVYTGPQEKITYSCTQVSCSHRWTINHTYASGDFVYGWVVYNGRNLGGTPEYSF